MCSVMTEGSAMGEGVGVGGRLKGEDMCISKTFTLLHSRN